MAYEKQAREGLVSEFYYIQRPSSETYKENYDRIQWQRLCPTHLKALNNDGKCRRCEEEGCETQNENF